MKSRTDWIRVLIVGAAVVWVADLIAIILFACADKPPTKLEELFAIGGFGVTVLGLISLLTVGRERRIATLAWLVSLALVVVASLTAVAIGAEVAKEPSIDMSLLSKPGTGSTAASPLESASRLTSVTSASLTSIKMTVVKAVTISDWLTVSAPPAEDGNHAMTASVGNNENFVPQRTEIFTRHEPIVRKLETGGWLITFAEPAKK